MMMIFYLFLQNQQLIRVIILESRHRQVINVWCAFWLIHEVAERRDEPGRNTWP